MIALVCEKNKFEFDNGDVRFSLILSSYNDYYKDYKIIKKKNKEGAFVPRNMFCSKDVFDTVSFGKSYDFEFTADNMGNSYICSATSSK